MASFQSPVGVDRLDARRKELAEVRKSGEHAGSETGEDIGFYQK
jgi:hypothetical protein